MLSTFNLDANAFITTIVCLATAFVLGSLIGLERQIRQRNAGLCQSSPPANRAMKELGNAHKQVVGRWANNRVENSHQLLRRRERAMLRFRRMRSLQKFDSVHASVHNLFNQERHLTSRQTYKERRSEALSEWRSVMG